MDKDKIKLATQMLIEAIGEDINREGLVETPERVAKMYEEVFSGIGETAAEHLATTFSVTADDPVIEKDIAFYSMCEHHLLPFYGTVAIAYIPDGRVAGLSKLVRTVDVYAHRPQIQEKLTRDIGSAVMEYLGAKGVMVIVEAEHLCMNMRGVKRPGTKTVTMMKDGIFLTDDTLCSEVRSLMGK